MISIWFLYFVFCDAHIFFVNAFLQTKAGRKWDGNGTESLLRRWFCPCSLADSSSDRLPAF
jgi:hypothetical protein